MDFRHANYRWRARWTTGKEEEKRYTQQDPVVRIYFLRRTTSSVSHRTGIKIWMKILHVDLLTDRQQLSPSIAVCRSRQENRRMQTAFVSAFVFLAEIKDLSRQTLQQEARCVYILSCETSFILTLTFFYFEERMRVEEYLLLKVVFDVHSEKQTSRKIQCQRPVKSFWGVFEEADGHLYSRRCKNRTHDCIQFRDLSGHCTFSFIIMNHDGQKFLKRSRLFLSEGLIHCWSRLFPPDTVFLDWGGVSLHLLYYEQQQAAAHFHWTDCLERVCCVKVSEADELGERDHTSVTSKLTKNSVHSRTQEQDHSSL